MTDVSSYTLESLRQDAEFVLYRGQRKTEPSHILVVAPLSNRPARTQERLEHEYALRTRLDPAWPVLPLALARDNGRTVLVLDDPGGEPLNRLLKGPLELPSFLRIAAGLANALAGVHERGLIHKDIKPANVLVNPMTDRVWLTGFSIASDLPRERQAPGPPETIAGTLAYMAPEQTGRMNRSIDSRSDLYSLGVTLYEMLTGALPFTASDPLEWVHCHIARQPMQPGERLKNVPGPVSAIILKLLAKTAEERYQTAAGAESDLRRCLAEWETRGRIDKFPVGEHDTPDRLLIPEKLYGRAHEIETLLASFERVVASGQAAVLGRNYLTGGLAAPERKQIQSGHSKISPAPCDIDADHVNVSTSHLRKTRHRVDEVLEPADVPRNRVVLPAVDVNEEQRTLRLTDYLESRT